MNTKEKYICVRIIKKFSEGVLLIMENFKAFLEFLKNFFKVTTAESSTSFGESVKKFFNVTVKAVTLTKDAILGAILGAGLYFVGIWIVSYICGKIFDDFDKVGDLLLRGEYYKGIFLLIIMFFVYYFVALAFANSGSILVLLSALAILVFWIGFDIYDCYNLYNNILDRVVTIGMYLAASFNEVLKIITIVLALVSSNNRY